MSGSHLSRHGSAPNAPPRTSNVPRGQHRAGPLTRGGGRRPAHRLAPRRRRGRRRARAARVHRDGQRNAGHRGRSRGSPPSPTPREQRPHVERDALRDTLGPDLVSEEGKAEHARIAAHSRAGRAGPGDPRRQAPCGPDLRVQGACRACHRVAGPDLISHALASASAGRSGGFGRP